MRKRQSLSFLILIHLFIKNLLSNAQEVKARNGHLVVFAFEGQDELIALADQVFIIPTCKSTAWAIGHDRAYAIFCLSYC